MATQIGRLQRGTYRMTGTGSTTAASWQPLLPVPGRWENYATPTISGWYRIEVIIHNAVEVRIGAVNGEGYPAESISAQSPSGPVVSVLWLGPFRRYWVGANASGEKITVLVTPI